MVVMMLFQHSQITNFMIKLDFGNIHVRWDADFFSLELYEDKENKYINQLDMWSKEVPIDAPQSDRVWDVFEFWTSSENGHTHFCLARGRFQLWVLIGPNYFSFCNDRRW